jgi:ABC-type molybdenum transport system ATPase subunit/photorepair protein PhrA
VAEAPPDAICTWPIPTGTADSPSTIEVRAVPGATTVVVGANGSGKSALAHWLYANAGAERATRIVAHRQIWLEQGGHNIAPSQYSQVTQQLLHYNIQPNSRWLDHNPNVRATLPLYRLLAAEAARNGHVSALVDRGLRDEELEDALVEVGESPIGIINRILRRSGLPIEIAVAVDQTFTASRLGGDPYPISVMSDGEKSSLLLAADVLTAPPGVIQIIDEPERHLHRAISAQLVHSIVAERPDCHLVTLTHDLDLADTLHALGAAVLVLNGCEWGPSNDVTRFDLTQLQADSGFPEGVRRAVLGGRTRVLFVEGDAASLDAPLFKLLYPEWPLQAVGGCSEVIRCVKGIAHTESLHWMTARGIVDEDRRTTSVKQALADVGILVLDVK